MPQSRPETGFSHHARPSPEGDLAQALSMGVAALGLDLPSTILARLLDYISLLAKWNRAYNLTAVREPRDMVTRHVLDSLAVLPWLGAGPLADIGSGPGIPGIPLAIAWPSLPVTLIDANLKMTRFAQAAVRELALDNVAVRRGRVETMTGGEYDQAISRAFASVTDFLRLADRAVRPGGRFLAMKGRLDPVELDTVPASFVLRQSQRLDVPGLDADRHLLVYERGGREEAS